MAHIFSDPLSRFIVQVLVIVLTARLLGVVAKKLGQPMVIAEITAGILLGPSLLGALWPAASETLFTPASLSGLEFLSQLGLLFFMFLMGLELDVTSMVGRGRASFLISNAGIAVPFGLGVALAAGLPLELRGAQTDGLSFMLFVGIAMSITAFPVLARIIRDKGLQKTSVGAVALTAAAFGDVAAWCLLAFVVGIARADGVSGAFITTGLTAVFALLVLYVVRPIIHRLDRYLVGTKGLTANGFSILVMVMLACAWTTHLIGVHAIFGAFLFGLVVSKNASVVEGVVSRVEDLVSVVLLPLFFALSGLRTQLGLLHSVSGWMICGVIVLVACLGKFGGTYAAARISGLEKRESAAIGILMNTRGLMELIVLNIGLDLGVISPTLFTMMVVMALVTTGIAAPLLDVVYSRKWSHASRTSEST